MAELAMDATAWANQQFGNCALGDKRRTKRLIKVAAQVAAKPDASTPRQAENWADCKAAYRLFDQEEVTFDAVIAPHCEQIRAVISGTYLIIQDTTELNFGYHRQLTGVGRLGCVDGRGFYLHSAMMVNTDGGKLMGMAAQEIYQRPLKKVPRVSSVRRKKRKRETDVWGRVVDRVGPSPAGARFIHVCDRGADNFEVYCHVQQQQADWVIRAAQLKRKVITEQWGECSLGKTLRRQPCLGTYTLEIRANNEQPARTALLEVRCLAIKMPLPKTGLSRYVRKLGITEIPMWAVEVREVNAPRGATRLHWVLLTSEKVTQFKDAWRVIEWYEKRPLIEEYHKCLKTGCRVEYRQYQTGQRLAPVIGLLSILAVRLLQLKTIARSTPDIKAAHVVPGEWLKALPRLVKTSKPIRTVKDFFRALARLGGFLGRKGDGEPGWQTIWLGLETLLLCLRGAAALAPRSG